MILKIFSKKNGENFGVFSQQLLFLEEIDRDIGL
jgi:hypothetical protein